MVKGVLKPRAQGRGKGAKAPQQRNQLATAEAPSSDEFDDFGRALDAAADGAAAAASTKGGRRGAAAAAARYSDGEEDEEDEAVLGISEEEEEDDDDDSDSEEGSEGDDDDDDQEEDEEEDLDALIARGGKAGRLARQAKQLGEELRIARGERDSDDEDGQAGGAKGRAGAAAAAGAAAWGANKRRYYGDDADDSGGSGEGGGEEGEDDEEAAARAEEDEARRLQAERAAGLAAEDFGLSGSGDDDVDDDDEESEEEEDAKKNKNKNNKTKNKAPHALVREERVAKAALADLPDEARRAALDADAPELLALLDELRGALREVRARAGPVLREVRAGGLATAGGLSYLEAKHLLLTQYCACLVAYLLLRAEGRPVRGHPVVARLVQLRAYLERARPIDRRLAYQVDKLLRATAAAQAADAAAGNGAGGGGSDAEAAAAAAAAAAAGGLRPNPAAFVGAEEEEGGRAGARKAGGAHRDGGGGGDEDDEGGGEGGAYRPPRLNPASMELDEEVGPDGQAVRRATARERHALREAARRARRSELVQELAAELAGAPEELRAEAPGLDSSAALLAARQRMEARERAEEELFARVPLSKAEAKKLKAQQRAGLAGAGGALDDFADEVADLVGGATGGAGGPSGNGILGRLSQRFGADLADQALGGGAGGPQHRSGDADLARRPDLHERRAAFDGAAGKKAARLAQEDAEAPPPLRPGGKRGAAAEGAEEDDFYAASRAARQAAKRLKGEAAALQRAAERTLPPPLPDPSQADGELRPITDAIQRNRGLTAHRRRDLKNPRKKHRVKYAEAGVRRKGQVQGVREAPATAGGYGGEATGIKARLARGRKLG